MKKYSFPSRRSSIEPIRMSIETPVQGFQNTTGNPRNSRCLIPRPQQKQRSSSSDNRATMIPVAGGIVRSKSNLGMSTPSGNWSSQNKRSHSQVPECSSAMRTGQKDNRILDDKHWQLETSRKIETFLINENITDKRLKDLTVNIFVHICNQLLKRLDVAFNITMANYVEQLPLILKKLGYQLPITKSLMISVNIPRNWGQVLGILEALVDLSEKAQFIDIEEDKIFDQAGLAYNAWTNGVDNAIGIYGKELYDEFSVEHREEREFIENQYKNLEERLAFHQNAKIKKMATKKEMLQIRENLNTKEEEVFKLRDLCEQKMKDLKKLKIILSNLELQKAEYEAEIKKIEAKIKNQGITMDDYKVKLNECQEVYANIEQQRGMIQEVENFKEKMIRDVEQQKKIISEIQKRYNHQFIQKCFEFSEFNDLSIPAFSTLIAPESEEILKQIIVKYKKMIDLKEASLKDIEEKIKSKTSQNEDYVNKIEAIILLNKQVKNDINTKLEEKQKLTKKINENKVKYSTEKEDILKVLNEPMQMPDLEQIKKQIQDTEDTKKYVESKTEQVIMDNAKLEEKCDQLEVIYSQKINAILDEFLKIHQQYKDQVNNIMNI